MRKKHLFLALLLAALMPAQTITAATLPQSVTPPEDFGPVPNEQQLEYHEQQLAAFMHFGPNTFTGKEWGDKTYTVNDFHPTAFHADEMVNLLQQTGFKRLIITAKHHDGFCLWNSKYTTFDVQSSPYKHDVLAALSAACTKHNMDMGLYLSPWDIHEPSYGYGPGGSKEDDKNGDYNEYYINQINEICQDPNYGNHGYFTEWWLDGAKGEGYDAQEYDMNGFLKAIRQGNPGVQIFGAGPTGGIHWIGNENGISPDETWAQQSDGTKSYWSVPECDVSLTQGWFWHPNSFAKSMEHLADIYFNSVGHGCPLLLNIPPNQNGAYSADCKERLQEFGKAIHDTFLNDFAKDTGSGATASSVRGNSNAFSASKVIDGKKDTYWTMDDGQTTGSVTVNLGKTRKFDVVSIKEYIKKGQRIKSFKVEYRNGNDEWKPFGKGKTIGAMRLVRAKPVEADQVRVTITAAKAVPLISDIGVFKAADAFTVKSLYPQGLSVTDDTEYTSQSDNWHTETIEGLNSTGRWAGAGQEITYTCTGTKFWVIGTKDPNHGMVDVYIDGSKAGSVDTSSPSRKLAQVLYESKTLEDKTHTIRLVCRSKAIGVDAILRLDNHGAGMFEMSEPNYSVVEGNSVPVTVRRIGGSKGKVSVLLTTPPGSAVQGQYYVDENQTLTFEDGETQKTVWIKTINNKEKSSEHDRFFVELTNPKNAILGFCPKSSVQILDDEANPGLYTEQNPIRFPLNKGEKIVCEAENFMLHPLVKDNNHMHVVQVGDSNQVDWWMNDEYIDAPFTAKRYGKYLLTLYYTSGAQDSAPNTVKISGDGIDSVTVKLKPNLQQGGGKQSVEIQLKKTVDQSNHARLRIQAVENKGPRLDKIEVLAEDLVEPQITVSSVNKSDTVLAEAGTAFKDIPLPKEVEVKLSDGTLKNISVNWQQGNYDSDRAGIYTVKGNLVLNEKIKNPQNLTASVTVETTDEKFKAELKQLYSQNKNRNLENYTEESVNEFQQALKQAGIVLNKKDTTVSELKKSINMLNFAVRQLTPKKQQPEKDLQAENNQQVSIKPKKANSTKAESPSTGENGKTVNMFATLAAVSAALGYFLKKKLR